MVWIIWLESSAHNDSYRYRPAPLRYMVAVWIWGGNRKHRTISGDIFKISVISVMVLSRYVRYVDVSVHKGENQDKNGRGGIHIACLQRKTRIQRDCCRTRGKEARRTGERGTSIRCHHHRHRHSPLPFIPLLLLLASLSLSSSLHSLRGETTAQTLFNFGSLSFFWLCFLVQRKLLLLLLVCLFFFFFFKVSVHMLNLHF